MAMTQKDRNTLRSNRVLLVQNVLISEELLSSLLETRILTEDMKEEIELKGVNAKKVGLLLDTIVKRGKSAFEEFIKALVLTHQEHLAEVLDANLTKLHVQRRDEDTADEEKMEVDSRVDGSVRMEKTLAEKAKDIHDNIDILVECQRVSASDIATYSSALSSNKVYKVSGSSRGRALIFNWEYFTVSHLDVRQGNQPDVENLEKLFARLQLHVEIISNLTDDEVYSFLEKEQQHPDHLSADMLVVCLLSHGVDGHVFAFNGVQIKIDRIIKYFEGDKCPALKGKPKLFFIQACQQVHTQNGKGVSQTDGITDGGGDPTSGADSIDAALLRSCRVEAVEKLESLVHDKADVLVARATVSGDPAHRNTMFGSLYIRCLVYVFSRQAQQDHVLDMLTEVANLMTQLKNKNSVQLPEKRDTFTKKLYFMPGYP